MKNKDLQGNNNKLKQYGHIRKFEAKTWRIDVKCK